jgi:hypothetical protein
MTKNKSVRPLVLLVDSVQTSLNKQIAIIDIPVGRLFPKQPKVDFEDCLKKTHVSALVESYLVFPKVNDEDFGRSEGEQSRFPFKIL